MPEDSPQTELLGVFLEIKNLGERKVRRLPSHRRFGEHSSHVSRADVQDYWRLSRGLFRELANGTV